MSERSNTSAIETNTTWFGKVDVRLPGKGNSNPHGARPVHLIITMIKWIRTHQSVEEVGIGVDVGIMLQVARAVQSECRYLRYLIPGFQRSLICVY